MHEGMMMMMIVFQGCCVLDKADGDAVFQHHANTSWNRLVIVTKLRRRTRALVALHDLNAEMCRVHAVIVWDEEVAVDVNDPLSEMQSTWKRSKHWILYAASNVTPPAPHASHALIYMSTTGNPVMTPRWQSYGSIIYGLLSNTVRVYLLRWYWPCSNVSMVSYKARCSRLQVIEYCQWW